MLEAYKMFGISDKIINLANECEKEIHKLYNEINDIALYNQAKVLKAFQNQKISQAHFGSTTGYGYGDIGREGLEKVFSNIYNTEDALVRIQFVSGTHTIATVLQALLMPGDEMLAISGKPYDTLCDVIGINESPLSLKNYGVKYSQIDLIDKERFDIEKIKKYLEANRVKLVHIQRSRGYEIRKALYISDIEEITKVIKKIDKDIIVMVDNCYGEFTEKLEPTDVGVDIACGSLIKNMGGGFAPMGGYIVGKKELIKLCADKLTCPGVGAEGGATLGQNRSIYQGVFMAPSVVKNAMQIAVFTAAIMEKLGFDIYPGVFDKRSDIVQTVKFGNSENLIKFVQGIQSISPVDSSFLPTPWDMPGYTDKVIMAAGTFIEGATIELSADGPLREPYTAYIQGGLTYESAKLALCKAVQNMIGEE
jgi:cystathionine beta-lyase family protein involved in aluminum resistance